MSKKKIFNLIAKSLTAPKSSSKRSSKGYSRGSRAGGTASKQKGRSR